jgi:hypothetical protein
MPFSDACSPRLSAGLEHFSALANGYLLQPVT